MRFVDPSPLDGGSVRRSSAAKAVSTSWRTFTPRREAPNHLSTEPDSVSPWKFSALRAALLLQLGCAESYPCNWSPQRRNAARIHLIESLFEIVKKSCELADCGLGLSVPTPSGSKCITSFRITLTFLSSSTKVLRSTLVQDFPTGFGFSSSRTYSPSVRSETSSISRSWSAGSRTALSSATVYLSAMRPRIWFSICPSRRNGSPNWANCNPKSAVVTIPTNLRVAFSNENALMFDDLRDRFEQGCVLAKFARGFHRFGDLFAHPTESETRT